MNAFATHPINVHTRKSVLLLMAVVMLWMVMPAQENVSDTATAQRLLPFLNQVVQWRRDQINAPELADQPSDLFFTSDVQATADQVTRLAFDYAHAEAAAVKPTGGNQNEQTTGSQTKVSALLSQAQNDLSATQKELEAANQRIPKSKKDRQEIEAQRQELQSEIDLAQARVDTLQQFSGFMRNTVSRNHGGTLSEQIDQLERSVIGLSTAKAITSSTHAPPVATADATSQAAQSGRATTQAKTQSSGIVGLIETALGLNHKLRNIDQLARQTASLQDALNRLRAPVTSQLQTSAAEGASVVNQPDSTDPAVLAQQKQKLDAVTADFKRLSAVAVPLNEAALLLNAYDTRLDAWHAQVEREYATIGRSIFIHAGLTALAVILLLAVSELWKRATFKYVHDARRRNQFLLLRRILVAIVIIFVVAFALVTEAGSLATYAGFVTAGLAVALQNVILSVVAYFFLIGRYGVHVGDRITVSGVTGDVFEIGLIRLHLIELAGSGSDMHPTGRAVVFSNSVVLQPTSSLFKQLPGSDFVWHEVKLSLSPSGDYRNIERRLMEAVDREHKTYQGNLRFQDSRVGAHLNWENPRPSSRLRFTDTGLEVIIRYPVEISRAGEIDDCITRALLDTIAKEPDVKLVPSTAPIIQAQPTTAQSAA